MGAVGADRELELQEEFVRRLDAVEQVELAPPQLAAELRELARRERQENCLAAVAARGVGSVLGGLDPAAHRPALRELPIAREEPAERVFGPEFLLAAAADHLAAHRGRTVERRD